MAIKFKAIERGEPGVAGGGTKKFYANIVTDGEVSIDELTKAIERMCTVNGADIRAVLYALVDVSVDQLANGKIIRLGELGSMRMSLSSEGKPAIEEVTASVIKGTSVIFTPGQKIKEMQNNLKFQKE